MRVRLGSFWSTFSFGVFKVFKAHSDVVSLVYTEMTGSTERNLFTIDASHHFAK